MKQNTTVMKHESKKKKEKKVKKKLKDKTEKTKKKEKKEKKEKSKKEKTELNKDAGSDSDSDLDPEEYEKWVKANAARNDNYSDDEDVGLIDVEPKVAPAVVKDVEKKDKEEKPREPPKCRTCAKSFVDVAELYAHRTTIKHVEAEKKLQKLTYCKLCQKQFTSIAQRDEHEGGKWHQMRLERAVAW